VEVPVEDEDEQDAAGAEEPAAVPVPSSGTKVKQAKKKIAQAAITSFTISAAAKPATQKQSRSVSSMLCKSPEEELQRGTNPSKVNLHLSSAQRKIRRPK